MDKDFRVIDLTHALEASIPSWDGKGGFELAVEADYKDCAPPDLFRTQKIICNAGIGTHIDAPAHAIEGGRTVGQLITDELIADCCVVDVSGEADENYVIMPNVIEEFEKQHGEILASTLVIFYTGWSKFWDQPEKYHNGHKFPSVDESTAELLLSRGVAGIGIDTLSCDTGASGFPVHRAILGADKYLIENIANVNLLPATGARLLILPLKIKGATEAPVSIIALI